MIETGIGAGNFLSGVSNLKLTANSNRDGRVKGAIPRLHRGVSPLHTRIRGNEIESGFATKGLVETTIPNEIVIELVEHHTGDALTTREIDVLRQAGSGNAR
jgi:hypothetical protein